ncbi:MAG TPA: hypothetical protein PKD91_03710 [Bacteroidia bacterium]|nr:hypothetical protein [Bacteroidia bacterium]
MTKKIVVAVTVFLLLAAGSVSAQKIKVESGSIDAVKSEKKVNIQYDYSSFGVGKFKTEAEYVDAKVKEYNEKEPGKGDKFKEGWIKARKDRYEPKFEELINEILAKSGAKYGINPEAKYTLIVKTTFVEPGFNVGVMKKAAAVSFEYIFVETANPTTVIAKLSQQEVPGSQVMGYDYDAGSRIAESYAKGGKMLGKLILD